MISGVYMEIRNLKTFIRVAEMNSFSRAAEQLNYAQSTVTAQIESLEKELGIDLFVRNGKRITLAAAGRDLLHYAYRFCALDDKVHHHFTGEGEPEGQLHVGVLESISASSYMRCIEVLLSRYQNIRLKVTIGTTLQLMEMLKKGVIDVIVLLDRPIVDAVFKTMYSTPAQVLFFASAESAYGQNRPSKLEELLGEHWLLTEKGCNYRKMLEDELSARGLSVEDKLEIGSTHTIIDLVAGGLGISVLPEFNLKKDLLEKRIVYIPVSDYHIKMYIQILVSSERWISPAIVCFCEEMIAQFYDSL